MHRSVLLGLLALPLLFACGNTPTPGPHLAADASRAAPPTPARPSGLTCPSGEIVETDGGLLVGDAELHGSDTPESAVRGWMAAQGGADYIFSHDGTSAWILREDGTALAKVDLLLSDGYLVHGYRACTEASAQPGIELPKVPTTYSMQHPPRFHFLTETGEQVETRPWTACLGNGCWDGFPTDIADLGSPEVLEFGWDLPDWQFHSVTFRPHGVDQGTCQREITVRAERTSDRTFRVEPAGPPGDYDVDIFGRGDGDAITTVRWHTPTTGQGPRPATGVAAIAAGDPGELSSYGVEVSVSNLDRHYPDAKALATITSADGSRAVDLPTRLHDCYRAGDLFFTAPDEAGQQAVAQLGSGPFHYRVTLTLDGTTYVGTGTWPDDVQRGNEPNVRLDWSPRLPSYAG